VSAGEQRHAGTPTHEQRSDSANGQEEKQTRRSADDSGSEEGGGTHGRTKGAGKGNQCTDHSSAPIRSAAATAHPEEKKKKGQIHCLRKRQRLLCWSKLGNFDEL